MNNAAAHYEVTVGYEVSVKLQTDTGKY